MTLEHRDRLVPLLRRPVAERLRGALPARGRERLTPLRADREDGRAAGAGRSPLDGGVRHVDDRPLGRVDRLAVEGEGRVAGQHDVQLLVRLALRLVVLPDEALVVLGRGPGVDAERSDVERRADGVPVRLARRRVPELADRHDGVAVAHPTSRRRARTTGSTSSSPSTRSSRFSTPAQSARVAWPARPRSSSSSARSASSTAIQSSRGVWPKRSSWIAWSRRSSPSGIRVVVDAEVDERVGEAGVAAVPLDHEERGRLPTAAVAAGRLRGVEAVHQPDGERRPGRRLERGGERVHRLARDEDVALRGVPVARSPTRPGVAVVAGEGRGAPVAVHDAELPDRAVVVGGREPVDDLLRREPLAEERQPLGAVARVRVRLGGDRAHVRDAHGTTEPTARNFDCVATPHWPASRSHAQMEYVATGASAIGELRQVELEQAVVARRGRTTPRVARAPPSRRPRRPPARRQGCRPHARPRAAATSSTESSTSAPSTSSDPSSAIAGTRLPVAPNQRDLTARSSRRSRARGARCRRGAAPGARRASPSGARRCRSARGRRAARR